MNRQPPFNASSALPVKYALAALYVSSLAIALIMVVVSIGGLLYQNILYPTETLRQWFGINDVLNLVAGLPLLLGSLWLTHRGGWLGLLCWPGALFYVLYVYLAYLISLPFDWLFPLYLLLVTLSSYTLIALIVGTDGETVRKRLEHTVPARTIAVILVGLALLIVARQMALMIMALRNQKPVNAQEIALWIDDFVVAAPALLLVGVQLWRRKALGYVAGAGLLLQYGVLALGLIPGMVSIEPIDVAGIAVILVMVTLCFVPFAFFVRGAVRSHQSRVTSPSVVSPTDDL